MKYKILIIEDNESNLYLLKYILEKFGYEVNAAQDGKEGLEKAGRIKHDLIVLDIQLPVIDGYTLMKIFKNSEESANIPIVVVTANVMQGDRERTEKLGCAAYIEKPIDPAKFITQIENLLPH